MRNARLGELQAEIKIGGRNFNNLRYTNDITPMAESKEEIKNLLMREEEEGTTEDEMVGWHHQLNGHGFG